MGGGFGSSRQQSATSPIAPGALPYVVPTIERISRGADNLPDVPQEEDLYSQAKTRLLEQLRPDYAARGMVTSQGPAGEAESKALQDLTTTFGQRRFERGMARQSMSMDTLTKLLTTILGQQTTGQSSGSSFQISGGR